MQILKEGKAHEHMAWFVKCDTCESELKILQGDPCSTKEVCWNCDRGQYYIRYVCPVCRSLNVAHTNSAFGDEANAKYERIILKKEDRDDMENWDNQEMLSDEDLKWINYRGDIYV